MNRRALKFLVSALAIVILSVTTIAGSATADVTFAKDAAPIIQKNCMRCHRAGEIAPMSFASYAEVRPWATAIRKAVLTRSMPPWRADPNPRAFENDPRLSQKDIDTLVGWVDEGATLGDPRDMPPNPTFTDGWNIGKPDVVFSLPEDFTV